MTGVLSRLSLFVGALLIGALLSRAVVLPPAIALPPSALLLVVVFLSVLPIFISRWRMALGAFFIWLVVEDLVRKLAGNSLPVYFVKDVALVVLVAAILLNPSSRRTWSEATKAARFPLYGFIAWTVVMAIPSATEDWRLPLLGLRLDFMFLPLVVAGYLFVRERPHVDRSLLWLAILGGVISGVGVIQAIIGPSFLSPAGPTPGLENLVLVRGLPDAAAVYRPTGTFVDPGRFSSLALVALAVCLGAFMIAKGTRRTIALAALIAAGSAIWASGGRGGIVIAAGLVAVAIVAPAFSERRSTFGRAFGVAAVTFAAAALLATFAPEIFSSRLAWYQDTLDPRSSENEWAFRWAAYSGDTFRGIQLGGAIGQGTGSESLGKQYLYGVVDASDAGLYQVEGGFATVAVEWGVIGLGLWVLWTTAWIRRQWRCVRAAQGSPVAALGLILFGWMILFLFVAFFSGFAVFQNYVANAFFWFLSGVIFALPTVTAAQQRQTTQGSQARVRVPS